MEKVFTRVNSRPGLPNVRADIFVACVSEKAPNDNWTEASPNVLHGLDKLCAEVIFGKTYQYYGHKA